MSHILLILDFCDSLKELLKYHSTKKELVCVITVTCVILLFLHSTLEWTYAFHNQVNIEEKRALVQMRMNFNSSKQRKYVAVGSVECIFMFCSAL